MEVNQVRQRSMRFEGWTSTILSVEPLLNRPLFRVQLVLADNSTEQIIVEPPILAVCVARSVISPGLALAPAFRYSPTKIFQGSF
jgi:hypothetical protein